MARQASMPGLLGHPHVHEDDVGQQLLGTTERLDTVPGLADDGDVALGLQHHLQAAAEQHVVVGDQHADRLGLDVLGLHARGGARPPLDTGLDRPRHPSCPCRASFHAAAAAPPGVSRLGGTRTDRFASHRFRARSASGPPDSTAQTGRQRRRP